MEPPSVDLGDELGVGCQDRTEPAIAARLGYERPASAQDQDGVPAAAPDVARDDELHTAAHLRPTERVEHRRVDQGLVPEYDEGTQQVGATEGGKADPQ